MGLNSLDFIYSTLIFFRTKIYSINQYALYKQNINTYSRLGTNILFIKCV